MATATMGAYEAGSGQSPTANPVDIYWDLKRAIEEQDRHNAKILKQKKVLSDLVKEWRNQGEIKPWEEDEISMYIDHASLNGWTPLIYVIPRCLGCSASPWIWKSTAAPCASAVSRPLCALPACVAISSFVV